MRTAAASHPPACCLLPTCHSVARLACLPTVVPPACPTLPPSLPTLLCSPSVQPGSIFDVVSTDFYEQRWVEPGEFILVPSKSAFSPTLLAQLKIAEDTGRRASAGYHVACPIMRVLF